MQPSQTLNPLTFPLRGSRLIEASAGTGKTYTLALLYIRLVLAHGGAERAFHRPLTPPEILVVTFTVAATQELRERIRTRLVEAAALFAEAPAETADERSSAAPIQAARCSSDPLLTLRADYPPADWPMCAQRLRQAAEWMDEAMITTIHGWCQRMLQEHTFATRGLFERALVTDQSDLIAEILRDYWRVHCYPLDADDARFLSQVITSPEYLRNRLEVWLSRRDARFCFKGDPLSCESLSEPLDAHRRWQTQATASADSAARLTAEQNRLQQAAREQWTADQAALESLLLELRPHLKGAQHASTRVEDFTRLLAEIAAWADGAPAPGRLKNFAQDAFAFKAKAPMQAAPAHPAFAAIARWQAKQLEPAPAAPPPPEPSLEAAVLAHAASWVARELPRRLLQRAEMGFDELLRDLDAALNLSDASARDPSARAAATQLAATIRRQFPVALIDEFQDTDPVQFGIFDAIYAVQADDQNTAFVMIGDPKQAIYGFRGADLQTYLAARRATSGRHDTLATNYRSTQAMVSACNRFFNHAETHPRGAFRFRTEPNPDLEPGLELDNPIPYIAVTAHGRDTDLMIAGTRAAAMTLWQLESETGVLSPDAYRQEMAARAASEIRRWLSQARRGTTGFQSPSGFTPLRPRDIAILVRTGTEAAVMRQALMARRINSVYLSDRDSVFQSAEAQDLIHWLRACAMPQDEDLVRAALGTNTLGVPLERLAQMQRDEQAWEAQLECFAGYQRIWRQRGVIAMLHQLLHDQDLPGRLLARAQGERVLTNLLHLAEWLQQAAAVHPGEQALIRQLAEHLEVQGEEFVVRLESDAELIQVVTIHKSKGLEYPLVLLPFICGWRAIDGRTSQVSYRPPGAGALNPAGRPTRYLEIAGRKLFASAWDLADDERLSEEMRLLYVAVTRARHAVWLGIAPLKSGNTSAPQLHKSAIGHVLTGGAEIQDQQALWAALEELCGDSADLVIAPAPARTPESLAQTVQAVLADARTPSHAPFRPWWIASYSALRRGAVTAPDGAMSETRGGATADTAAQETALEETLAAPLMPASWRDPQLDPQFDLKRDADTSLEQGQSVASSAPALCSLHALPRGSRYGTFLHGILEWAAVQQHQDDQGRLQQGFAATAASASLRRAMLTQRCALRGLSDWVEPLGCWLGELLERRWLLPAPADVPAATPSLALRDLQPEQIQVEMEFWIEAHALETRRLDRLVQRHCLAGAPRPDLRSDQINGLLKGFIDLVFEHDGRYYVLDWKSNWLGPDDQAYTPAAMRATILHHRYDLQYALYLLALHRQLRARLPGYDYDRHVGGALYVFLRGGAAASQGLFADRPSRALIEALDQLFAGARAHSEAI
ncbi:exodeoxyribonuclease V subunit beta [Thiocapsa imhoffii]|uniref:RecBCD enzyme subunit RecB n=1 Tax=Thiocapsa imhoffii TaxID=382777 RepID=A0A9X1BBN6_9GAMM|nr:exodeoxyribonuclease V subunit beta [Thiocapsa imhoffii]MBK1646776.1 exodeoxyribonuclease V subunit beta [Thiocapsa imhoffii]